MQWAGTEEPGVLQKEPTTRQVLSPLAVPGAGRHPRMAIEERRVASNSPNLCPVRKGGRGRPNALPLSLHIAALLALTSALLALTSPCSDNSILPQCEQKTIMASTAGLSSTPKTGTSLLAMHTPFAQPATCSDIFSTTTLTTTLTTTYVTSGSTTLSSSVYAAKVAVSNPADPRFTTCQPPGWAGVVPESRFSFSPAVCPSGWTAHYLGTAGPVTTAHCCARYDSRPPEALRHRVGTLT
jgi:hypothetical protein